MQKLLRLIFILLLLLPEVSYSQAWKHYRQEVSIGAGAGNFLGELGGANQVGTNGLRDLEFSRTRPAFKIGYRYLLNPNIKIGADLLYGRLNGDDKLTKEPFRNNRNLHFRSPVVELGIFLEYYPFTEKTGNIYGLRGVIGNKKLHFSPYISVGFGGFWFNPSALYPLDNKWYNLHSIQTENVSYKRVSFFIPTGVGIKSSLSRKLSIGLEISGRKTFTDYIDDVSTVYVDQAGEDAMTIYLSNPTTNIIPPTIDGPYESRPTDVGQQRGDPTDNDSYLFAIFTVHYRFLRYKRNLPKF
jgi:hypothetical protein